MIRKRKLLDEIQELRSDLECLNICDDRRVNQIIELKTKVKKLESTMTNVDNRKGLATVKQLQCAAKGHNFVFEKDACVYFGGWLLSRKQYQFKCTNCDLTITKTIDELTSIEKEALKDLGILEEENGKTR